MKLYAKFFLMSLRSQMEYKASFLMTSIGIMFTSLGELIAIHFLMRRFHSIAGFNYPQVLICYSIVVMAFTLAELAARGFDHFPTILRNSEFDRIMLRPANIMLQVLTSRLDLQRASKVLLSGVVLAYAITHSGIEWTAMRVLVLILMILGGTMMFIGLFILFATICFFTLEGLEVFNILTDGSRNYGEYPVSIYGKWILRLYTFVLPLACVQYYPLNYLLGRTNSLFYGLLPLMGFVFLIPCRLLWSVGVRHYKSNGS